MLDVLIYSTIFGILGARLYYCIFEWDRYKDNPIEILYIWNGGLAIYGGIIGGIIAAFIVCRVRKMNFWNLMDIASMSLLIGQGIGRWGNFINQEAYGAFTGSSFWGMQSEKTVSEMGEGLVHPCFLYESIWCIAGFFILNHFSKKRRFSGEISLMYCVWYGFGRGFIELLRTDSLMIGNLKVSCLLSFLICIAAFSALAVLRNRYKENSGSADYEEVFTDNGGPDTADDLKEEENEQNN